MLVDITRKLMQPFSTQPVLNTMQPPAITFVFHDAGETKALMPVMRQLDALHIDYLIIVEATSKTVLKNNPHVVPTIGDAMRMGLSNSNWMMWFQVQYYRALQAHSCVVGMVSPLQKQWAQFFKQTGRKAVGYYDSFNYHYAPEHNKATQFIGALTHLITPSEDTADYFKVHGFGDVPIDVLGQPATEATADVMAQTDKTALARQLGINLNQPTILYLGQYGPNYAEALTMFCKSVQQFPQVNALIALHPGTSGQIERDVIQQIQTANRIQILPRHISSEAALAFSDVVLSQTSTLATQAALLGKKVILVGNSETTRYAFNPLIEYQIAPLCNQQIDLDQALEKDLAAIERPDHSDFYHQCGIPKNAANALTEVLLQPEGVLN